MKIKGTIHGPRLVIRNYERSDLDFVTGMWLDGENGRYMSDPTADHVDAVFQAALDTLHESKFGYYLILELAETGEAVGSFSVFPDEDGAVYDIGYCIHKRHWNRGFGTEALALMLDWLRAQGAQKVTAEAAAANAASNALLRKFGFTVERQTRFQKYNMNVWFDSHILAKTL